MAKLCRPLTVELLDAPEVVLGQLEVVGVHPLVEWRHDGAGVARVLQPQRVAQLVHSYQEEAVPCSGPAARSAPAQPGLGSGRPRLRAEAAREPALSSVLGEAQQL